MSTDEATRRSRVQLLVFNITVDQSETKTLGSGKERFDPSSVPSYGDYSCASLSLLSQRSHHYLTRATTQTSPVTTDWPSKTMYVSSVVVNANLYLATIGCLVLAQGFSGPPACAIPCLASALSAAGCSPDDLACRCGPTQAAIGSLVAPCLLASCPATVLGAIESVGSALCAQQSTSPNLTTSSSNFTVLTGNATFGVSPPTVTVISAATVTYITATTAGSETGTSNPTASNNSSLGSGATAGIAIAAVAAVIGIGLLLWFVVFRRRRSQIGTISPDTKTLAPVRTELGGHGKSKPQELHAEHQLNEHGTEGNFPLHPVEIE